MTKICVSFAGTCKFSRNNGCIYFMQQDFLILGTFIALRMLIICSSFSDKVTK